MKFLVLMSQPRPAGYTCVALECFRKQLMLPHHNEGQFFEWFGELELGTHS